MMCSSTDIHVRHKGSSVLICSPVMIWKRSVNVCIVKMKFLKSKIFEKNIKKHLLILGFICLFYMFHTWLQNTRKNNLVDMDVSFHALLSTHNQNDLQIPRFFSFFKSCTVFWHCDYPFLSFFWISHKIQQMRVGFSFVSLTVKCCLFSDHGKYILEACILFETSFRKLIKNWHSKYIFWVRCLPDTIKLIVADTRYFTRSKFLRNLVHKNFFCLDITSSLQVKILMICTMPLEIEWTQRKVASHNGFW